MAYYSIGEFTKKTGLSIPKFRYYEQEKSIYSHRKENNRRYYDSSNIAWTQFIISLKKTETSIKNIQEYANPKYKRDSTMSLDKLHKQQSKINQYINCLEIEIKSYLSINTS